MRDLSDDPIRAAVESGQLRDELHFHALRMGALVGIPAGIAAGILLVAVSLGIGGTLDFGDLLAGILGGGIAGLFLGGFTALNVAAAREEGYASTRRARRAAHPRRSHRRAA